MKKLCILVRNQGIISITVIAAVTLIILSLLSFNVRVNNFIKTDMRSQIEAIQKISTAQVQSELNYLKRLTLSAAQLISQTDIQTDEAILKTLKDYAENTNISRTLFVTLDGHSYTSYAGYLGQSDDSTSLDGIPLSQITSPIFSQPYYAQELNEIIFGVVCPVTMGEQKGVLISSYDVSRFNDIFKNDFIGGLAEIGILNSLGEVVVGKDVTEFKTNVPDALSPVEFTNSSAEEMRTSLANGISGFSSYYVKGVERYCSFAPVKLNDWYVIVMVTENALRKTLSQFENYGLQLTIELLIIMITLLLTIIAVRYKEHKRGQTILRQAAMTDGLTGIYNRFTAENKIASFLDSCDHNSNFALLVIDVDNFKNINDTCGHVFGDCVLVECANRLKNTFDKEDIIGRMGGDEFVVLVKNFTDAEQVYEQMRHFLSNFYVSTASGEYREISLSAGIALSGECGHSFMEMYQKADESLYRAKAQGKGRFSL